MLDSNTNFAAGHMCNKNTTRWQNSVAMSSFYESKRECYRLYFSNEQIITGIHHVTLPSSSYKYDGVTEYTLS